MVLNSKCVPIASSSDYFTNLLDYQHSRFKSKLMVSGFCACECVAFDESLLTYILSILDEIQKENNFALREELQPPLVVSNLIP